MISDAVLNNLITTIGAVCGTVIPTLAVVWSRRKTRDDLTQQRTDLSNVHEDVRGVKQELQMINDVNVPGPTIVQRREQTDRERTRDVTRDEREGRKK